MSWEMRSRARLRDDTLPCSARLARQRQAHHFAGQCAPWNLEVKLEQTGLGQHLDLLLSTHTFGFPKEDQRLWQAV